jgi:hypothetical protein
MVMNDYYGAKNNTNNAHGVAEATEMVARLEMVLKDRLAWSQIDTSAIRMKTIGYLRMIRKLVSSDGPQQDVTKKLIRANYIPMLMTNAPVLLRFPETTDEALRTVIAISRTTDANLVIKITPALFEHGALIFSVLALKEHRAASNSINIQGLELWWTFPFDLDLPMFSASPERYGAFGLALTHDR